MTTPLQQLQELGQSPWLDYITRDLLTTGKLAAFIRRGDVTGLTSNPTIFEQAITRSTAYDTTFDTLARAGKSAAAIVDALTVADIKGAADAFATVYARTKRRDGYVSIEVDPSLAHDAEGTLREAKRIWRTVNKPNLMVKIPATREGLVAIEHAIAAGINVNVTLIFALARYGAVMDAYVSGLTRRLESGARIDRIASVASFFVSRIDTAVDRLLDDRIATLPAGDARTSLERLRGAAAIANAKLAYAAFRERFAPDRFGLLARAGGEVQRPLWASTSTKNPAYPDVYYVEALIGPDTVDTLPPPTLDAYRDHGRPAARIGTGVEDARTLLARLAAAGIDFDTVTARLEQEGVAAFETSWRSLLATTAARREATLITRRSVVLPESFERRLDTACRTLDASEVSRRLWAKDPTLWPAPDEATARAIVERLGWLDVGRSMPPHLPSLQAFADEIRAEGITHAVLCGMGGSSLAPEVLRRTLGVRPGFVEVTVLDSTDPSAVAAATSRGAPEQTLYLISSKSGDTVEVQAFLAHCWGVASAALGDRAGRHFVAITDPGTTLEALARDRRFRRVFLNPPDIGGRFSALSLVGLVPAALMGHDLGKLLSRADRMLTACGSSVRAATNPGLRLGATLGTALRARRDKLTFVLAPKVASFGDWAEQLVAESTGKHGVGIIPIVGESLRTAARYGADRLFVGVGLGTDGTRGLRGLARAGHPLIALRLNDPYDIAAEFVRWEVATAVAGHLMGVNPFDQPDVQSTKTHTAQLLSTAHTNAARPCGLDPHAADVATQLWKGLQAGRATRYIAVTAFFAPSPRRTTLLTEFRALIGKRLGVSTTLGFGPRFLHSTGQLHKGGPATVTIVQLVSDPGDDVAIPGASYGFRTLLAAQADGDHGALRAKNRPVIRVDLGRNVDCALEVLVDALKRPARPARRPARTQRDRR